jgi:hypothetical protein
MGFFSWKTSDTDESITNRHSTPGAFPVKMLDDKGNEYLEENYEGYGDFGGMDFYALVDTMNGGTGDRMAGIKIMDVNNHDTPPPGVKAPKLVTASCTTKWADLPDCEDCPNQGYFF